MGAQPLKSGSQPHKNADPSPKVDIAPLPGLKAVEGKAVEGARPDEFTEEERAVIAKKAYIEDEARIRAAIAAEPGPPKELVPKRFGVFADSPTKFVVTHEDIGTPHAGHFRRGDEVTYRDLCEFDTTKNALGLYEPDFNRPRVAKTREIADRLVRLGAIRPLVLAG